MRSSDEYLDGLWIIFQDLSGGIWLRHCFLYRISWVWDQLDTSQIFSHAFLFLHLLMKWKCWVCEEYQANAMTRIPQSCRSPLSFAITIFAIILSLGAKFKYYPLGFLIKKSVFLPLLLSAGQRLGWSKTGSWRYKPQHTTASITDFFNISAFCLFLPSSMVITFNHPSSS